MHLYLQYLQVWCLVPEMAIGTRAATSHSMCGLAGGCQWMGWLKGNQMALNMQNSRIWNEQLRIRQATATIQIMATQAMKQWTAIICKLQTVSRHNRPKPIAQQSRDHGPCKEGTNLPIWKMSLARATHLMDIWRSKMFNCKLPFVNWMKSCRESKKVGQVKNTHHVTQIPDYQFPKRTICFVHFLGGPYVEILFFLTVTVTRIRIDSIYIYMYIYIYTDNIHTYIYIMS